MAFDESEKAQISAYLRAKGFRFAMIADSESELENFVPVRGELVFVKDEQYMVVGDGVLETPLCRKYVFWQLLKTLPSLSEKTFELWKRINQTMGVGQVKDFLYPPDMMIAMWSTVPSNFEVKWEGKTLPAASPFRPEWENGIKDEGWFLRNFNPAKPKELGAFEEQAVIEHTHTAPAVMTSYGKKVVDAIILGDETWCVRDYNFAGDVYTMDPSGGELTRPVGIGVFRVQKLAEASQKKPYKVANKWDDPLAFVTTDYLNDREILANLDGEVSEAESEIYLLKGFFYTEARTYQSIIRSFEGATLRAPLVGNVVFAQAESQSVPVVKRTGLKIDLSLTTGRTLKNGNKLTLFSFT